VSSQAGSPSEAEADVPRVAGQQRGRQRVKAPVFSGGGGGGDRTARVTGVLRQHPLFASTTSASRACRSERRRLSLHRRGHAAARLDRCANLRSGAAFRDTRTTWTRRAEARARVRQPSSPEHDERLVAAAGRARGTADRNRIAISQAVRCCSGREKRTPRLRQPVQPTSGDSECAPRPGASSRLMTSDAIIPNRRRRTAVKNPRIVQGIDIRRGRQYARNDPRVNADWQSRAD